MCPYSQPTAGSQLPSGPLGVPAGAVQAVPSCSGVRGLIRPACPLRGRSRPLRGWRRQACTCAASAQLPAVAQGLVFLSRAAAAQGPSGAGLRQVGAQLLHLLQHGALGGAALGVAHLSRPVEVPDLRGGKE